MDDHQLKEILAKLQSIEVIVKNIDSNVARLGRDFDERIPNLEYELAQIKNKIR